MATESNIPVKGMVVETEALKALEFYAHNYTTLMFAGLGLGNKNANTIILTPIAQSVAR